MNSDKDQLPSTIRELYLKLKQSAAELNTASDELNASISNLEAKLKTLSLGVSAWVNISVTKEYTRQIGYAKVNKEWGLAIRILDNDLPAGKDEWPFTGAPRWMRIESIALLPELLEKLISNTNDTEDKIMKRVPEVNAVVSLLENSDKGVGK